MSAQPVVYGQPFFFQTVTPIDLSLPQIDPLATLTFTGYSPSAEQVQALAEVIASWTVSANPATQIQVTQDDPDPSAYVVVDPVSPPSP